MGDLAIPKDLHGDPAVQIKGDQERGACAPGVINPDLSNFCLPAPDGELPAEVPRLIGSAVSAGEGRP